MQNTNANRHIQDHNNSAKNGAPEQPLKLKVESKYAVGQTLYFVPDPEDLATRSLTIYCFLIKEIVASFYIPDAGAASYLIYYGEFIDAAGIHSDGSLFEGGGAEDLFETLEQAESALAKKLEAL